MQKVDFHALSQHHCLLAQSQVSALQHYVTQEVLMSPSASIKPFSEAEFHTFIQLLCSLGSKSQRPYYILEIKSCSLYMGGEKMTLCFLTPFSLSHLHVQILELTLLMASYINWTSDFSATGSQAQSSTLGSRDRKLRDIDSRHFPSMTYTTKGPTLL